MVRGIRVLAAAVLVSAAMVSTAFAETTQPVSVIPLPAHIEPRAGGFVIRPGTKLLTPRDPRAARIVRYFAELMETTRGIRLETAASGGDIAFELRRPIGAGAIKDPLLQPEAVPRASPDAFQRTSPEAYAIDVSPRRIVVSAADPRGLLYGAVTLWQMATTGPQPDGITVPQSDGNTAQQSDGITVPSVRIEDSPRFGWRGLMLDSARHYQSPEFILRFIDWMALHKLNVLHWHLTDDQAWRLEIKKYPRLTSVGAWRVPAGAAPAADIDPTTGRPRLYGGFYSQETVRKIIAHATERNVTIVPEIDMPGHATAAVVAYPRLASIVPAPAAVPSDWGVYSNLYNADETTFEFLENVLEEVVHLFPGKFVHVGGDEAVKDQWKASPHIQQRMRELGVSSEAALQSYFVERFGKFLTSRHRRLIGWDEILEGGIPHDATIMSWRGVDGAYAAAAAGHDAVLSPWPTLYFDNRQDPADTQPGRAHVSSLEDVYKFDPVPASLAANQRQHILGLQANLWTEHMRTEQRVEYMAFPRAAAVAEVGWSPGNRLALDGFLVRLQDQMKRYERVGIHAHVAVLPTGASGAAPAVAATAASGASGASGVTPAAAASGVAPQTNPAGLSSHELKSCTDKLRLLLEDDAPLKGDRAVFTIDIMNPCWIYPAVDLSAPKQIRAAVGQVPFNFQLGADVRGIKLHSPQTPAGELEVRMDNCDGERVAVLPLQPALVNDSVTELPAANIAQRGGTHDLCLQFTQRSLDPMWVIDRVRLE